MMGVLEAVYNATDMGSPRRLTREVYRLFEEPKQTVASSNLVSTCNPGMYW